jgi:hypothetical protein
VVEQTPGERGAARAGSDGAPVAPLADHRAARVTDPQRPHRRAADEQAPVVEHADIAGERHRQIDQTIAHSSIASCS